MHSNKRNKIKRIVSLVLVCVLLQAFVLPVPLVVHANNGAMLTVNVPTGPHEPGDTFVASLALTDNPGFAGMFIRINIPSGLEVINVQPVGTDFTDLINLVSGLTMWDGWGFGTAPPTPLTGHFFAIWARTVDYTTPNATLLDVTFRVTSAAVNGSNPITVAFEGAQGPATPVNLLEQPLTIGIANSSVMIQGATASAGVNLTGVAPNGLAGTEDTTELVLTFDDPITATIASGNIAITNTTVAGRTVNAGTVTGVGNTRTVQISGGWNDGDQVTVAITGVTGYTVATTATVVALHRYVTQLPTTSITAITATNPSTFVDVVAVGIANQNATFNITGDSLSDITAANFSVASGLPSWITAGTISLSDVTATTATLTVPITVSANTENARGPVTVTINNTITPAQIGALPVNQLGVAPEITTIALGNPFDFIGLPAAGATEDAVFGITGVNISGIVAADFSIASDLPAWITTGTILLSNVTATTATLTVPITVSFNGGDARGPVNVTINNTITSAQTGVLPVSQLGTDPAITAITPTNAATFVNVAAGGISNVDATFNVAGANLSGLTAANFSVSSGLPAWITVGTISLTNVTATGATVTVPLTATSNTEGVRGPIDVVINNTITASVTGVLPVSQAGLPVSIVSITPNAATVTAFTDIVVGGATNVNAVFDIVGVNISGIAVGSFTPDLPSWVTSAGTPTLTSVTATTATLTVPLNVTANTGPGTRAANVTINNTITSAQVGTLSVSQAAPGPAITSITPNAATTTSFTNVAATGVAPVATFNIVGTNMTAANVTAANFNIAGLPAWITAGTVSVEVTSLTAATLTVTLTVQENTGLARGPVDATVTNTISTGVNGTLTVTQAGPPPTITSIMPNAATTTTFTNVAATGVTADAVFNIVGTNMTAANVTAANFSIAGLPAWVTQTVTFTVNVANPTTATLTIPALAVANNTGAERDATLTINNTITSANTGALSVTQVAAPPAITSITPNAATTTAFTNVSSAGVTNQNAVFDVVGTNLTAANIAGAFSVASGLPAWITSGTVAIDFNSATAATVTVPITVANNTGAARGPVNVVINNTITSAQNGTLPVSQEAAPVWSISLSPSTNQNFGQMELGGTLPVARTITITNTGNQPTGALAVTLGGTDSGSFALGGNTSPSLTTASPGNTATFTVVPTATTVGIYTATVTVSGGNGISEQFNVSFEVYANPPVIQTPATLPIGVIGLAYNQTLAATGTGTITWSATPSDLPDGLSLSSAGVISGTPLASVALQVYSIVVTATSAHGTDSRTFLLEISDTVTPPTITTTTLPGGAFDVAYSQQLNATGTGPFTWTVSAGALPGGLTLNSLTGIISGTPNAPGTFNFTVRAEGPSPTSYFDTQALSVVIAPPAPTSVNVTATGNATTVQAGTTLQFNANVLPAQASQTVTWSVSGYAGASINTNGLLAVTPAVPAGTTLTITATAASTSIAGTATVNVTAAAPTDPNLVSITAPPAISRTHAQATAGNWGLPTTVGIVVAPAGSPTTANVSWGSPSPAFNHANQSAQTLIFTGTVTLPSDVTNTNNVSLTTTVTVNVAAVGVVTPTVTSVSVTPASGTIQRGQARQFAATVLGTNTPPQTVTWSVEGNVAAGTTISSTGLLAIASNQATGNLTIRATSTFNTSISGTATVTVHIPDTGNGGGNGGGNDGGGWTPPTTPTLSAPSNVRLADTTISWNAVNNATSYRIYVGGTFRTSVTTTSFDLATLGLPIGTHAIRIRAVGTNVNNSALSTTINFVVTEQMVTTPPAEDAVPMPAYDVQTDVQRQLEQEVEIVVLTANEAVSDIHVYRDTLELLLESEMPLRIVRDIVWVELSVEQIEELLESMGDSDYELVIGIRILLDEEAEDDAPPAESANIYFVAASINFTVGDETLQAFSDVFTLYADLSDFNLQGLNYHRIVAVRDGRVIGGNLSPLTAIFTVDVAATGEIIIAYIENLIRLDMALGSPIIRDLAGNAPMQEMDVLPVIVDDRTLIPVRFIAEALGADVDWTRATDDHPMLVHITINGETLTFGIGEVTPELAALGMDVPAQINENRTMVPLRFISEFFGATVTWDSETRGIEILFADITTETHESSPLASSVEPLVTDLREDDEETEEVTA